MTREDLKAQAREAVKLLGDTTEVVAERLLAERCQGERTEGQSCPVARYLAKHLPHDVALDVCDCGVTIYQLDLLGASFVAFPWPVSEFIRQFDRGEFPILETAESF